MKFFLLFAALIAATMAEIYLEERFDDGGKEVH
jgi:hypothetical protein